MTILAWYNRLVEIGCVYHREPVQDRPYVADETTEYAADLIVRSPRKSTKRASLSLTSPRLQCGRL